MNCAGFRWTSSLFKKLDSLNLASLGKEIIHSSGRARQWMRPESMVSALQSKIICWVLSFLHQRGPERFLKLQLQTFARLVSLICAYAPTLTSASELKDRFYEDLSAAISKVPPQEHLFIFGDFNGRVGADHSSWPTCLGHFGIGNMNENGQRLLEFCCHHSFSITNTFFMTKP